MIGCLSFKIFIPLKLLLPRMSSSYIHVHTHTRHAHTHTHTHMRACTGAHTHACTRHVHACTWHAHTRHTQGTWKAYAHAHGHAHADAHTCTCAHPLMHALTCMCTRMHVYTHLCFVLNRKIFNNLNFHTIIKFQDHYFCHIAKIL